jgi:lon-related putative ATP-dependent protease
MSTPLPDGPHPNEVPSAQLRWRCDPRSFAFNTTEEIACRQGIIGQDRAMDAIRLGLLVRSKGHNVFVCGEPGTGRTSSVRHLLETMDGPAKIPPDIVYVNSFKNPDVPVAIALPAGQGRKLQEEMRELIVYMRQNIQTIYESDAYKERTKEIIERYRDREKEMIREFEDTIRSENFALIQVQLGPFSKPEIAPMIEGEPHQIDRLENNVREGKFSRERFDELRDKYQKLTAMMEETFREARELKKKLRVELAALEKEFGRPVVDDYLNDLKGQYGNGKVNEYLEGVREQILSNMDQFTERDGEEQQAARQPDANEDRFLQYQVNVLVDNSATTRSPVVVETSPSYRNLFGTIEKVIDRSGHWRTDFTRIKGGSLLTANGGYLVLQLYDLVSEPGVWSALKRTLKNRQVDIQGYDPLYLFTVSALKPEPIPVNVRVIVIGDDMTYQLLYNYDPDFRKIFKVKADFDSVMPREADSLEKYTNFICKIQKEEELLPLDRTAVAAVIEHGVRSAGRQKKLSTRFSDVADLVRESSYWAESTSDRLIEAKHVRRAIDERVKRVGLIEDKIREMITEGSILVDTEGSKVGQVNGLSILSLGYHLFGRPTRITVKTGVGRAGVINIERESALSGSSFNKGVMILEGFIRSHFAQDKPLAMTASICFEQSYSGIDGDSASSSELYALLSSLADVPVRQDIAVTGSVNQHGEIQPIGGVNEKIEGFYDVCKARGLTGSQGVLIPHQNVQDLMLRPDVVQAVETGSFHVYSIRTIAEGIEILTGVPAGYARIGGEGFPPDSVFARVDRRFRDYAGAMRRFTTDQPGP